ncbi:MAG TPA: hypothetical protein VM686_00415 [Polyangiaceae bacterium]|nr:hypothetical protein [Polyangiaceae bacterium]
MATPAHIGQVEPIASLVDATDRYRAHNDAVAESQSRERGSLPPSSGSMPAAPVSMTPDRAKQIARALRNNHTLLTLVALVDVEPPISAIEFQVFCTLATKGASK